MEACSIGGVIAISFAQLWFEAALILGHVCGPQLSVDAVVLLWLHRRDHEGLALRTDNLPYGRT